MMSTYVWDILLLNNSIRFTGIYQTLHFYQVYPCITFYVEVIKLQVCRISACDITTCCYIEFEVTGNPGLLKYSMWCNKV